MASACPDPSAGTPTDLVANLENVPEDCHYTAFSIVRDNCCAPIREDTMEKKKMTVAVLLAMVVASHALAYDDVTAFIDGETLNGWCVQYSMAAHGQKANTYEVAQCSGFVLGVVDTESNRKESTFCLPEPVERRTVTDIVGKFLHDHPEKRPLAAYQVIIEAMTQAFPCH
jgi:hypothetical protein